MMYGAKKPDEPWPWHVTQVYSYSISDGCTKTTLDWSNGSSAGEDERSFCGHSAPDLARLLSIRRCDIDEAPLTAHGVTELAKVLEAEREAMTVRARTREERFARRTPLNANDTKSLSALVSLLSAERAGAYKSWL